MQQRYNRLGIQLNYTAYDCYLNKIKYFAHRQYLDGWLLNCCGSEAKSTVDRLIYNRGISFLEDLHFVGHHLHLLFLGDAALSKFVTHSYYNLLGDGYIAFIIMLRNPYLPISIADQTISSATGSHFKHKGQMQIHSAQLVQLGYCLWLENQLPAAAAPYTGKLPAQMSHCKSMPYPGFTNPTVSANSVSAWLTTNS